MPLTGIEPAHGVSRDHRSYTHSQPPDRLNLAPTKWDFVSHNVIDLVVVIVPFLRRIVVLAGQGRALPSIFVD